MTGGSTHVRHLEGWVGDARLYRVDPPVADRFGERTNYVIVSVVWEWDCGHDYTMIFPASVYGKTIGISLGIKMGDGDKDHGQALRYAGYEIVG